MAEDPHFVSLLLSQKKLVMQPLQLRPGVLVVSKSEAECPVEAEQKGRVILTS